MSYNRRKLLADGRVVMSPNPIRRSCDLVPPGTGPCSSGSIRRPARPSPVCSPGRLIPVWSLHPMCRPITRGSSARSLGNAFGFPLVFLQGPSGNINLPFQEMNRAEMLQSVRKIMPQLSGPRWSAPRRLARRTGRSAVSPRVRFVSLGPPTAGDQGRNGADIESGKGP